MSEITLKLDSRTIAGKKVTNLRKNGIVPSVVYGKAEARNTQAGLVEITKAVHTAGKHTPITLEIDGKKKLAIIKSVDVEPVRHRIRHVAFHTINQNEAIVTEVPIRLVGQGESAAEKAGLIVLQALEHTEIKAKPGDLPEALELSVENLATADDKLTLGDIKLPSGVEFADHELDLELVVANVYEPSALQAQNEAAAGDAEDAAPADDTAVADEAPAEEE
jgi:large subunit ribosomal protein L25